MSWLGIGITLASQQPVSGGGGASSTFNPADKAASVTLTNTNLTAANVDGTYEAVRGTTSKSSGKWYFEIKILNDTSLTNLGIGNATASLANFVGSDTNSCGYFSGSLFYNGSLAHSGPTYTTNSIVQIAVDLTNALIWAGVDNASWAGAGSPSAGTLGTSITGIGAVFPMFCSKSGQGTAQFTAASQSFAPPTGFTAWG